MILRKKNFYRAIYFFCKAVNLDFQIANNAVIISPPPPPPPKEEKESKPAWL